MKIVLASTNHGKLAEMRAQLNDSEHEIVAQPTLNFPPAPEVGDTFAANALAKAHHAHHHSGLAAMADDSGLVVEHLAGAPGLYSARYAGATASDGQNNAKLLRAMVGVPIPQRAAYFHCVVALVVAGAPPMVWHGRWPGRIAFAPAGMYGFGYDPIFFVSSLGATAAQLSPNLKNRHSHRALALHQLKQHLAVPSPPP